jgi:Glutathione S-transferase, N-terminal domain
MSVFDLTMGAGERTIAARSASIAAGTGGEKEVAMYGSWFCPYVQRVWIALEEKQIDYQYIEIDPYHPATEDG